MYIFRLNHVMKLFDSDSMHFKDEIEHICAFDRYIKRDALHTLYTLVSNGWFQERIRAWVHNQIKLNKLTVLWKILKCQISSFDIVITKSNTHSRNSSLCGLHSCDRSHRITVWPAFLCPFSSHHCVACIPVSVLISSLGDLHACVRSQT